jgi:anti-sigma regulatory factor (Ser/Thr protein kinase)
VNQVRLVLPAERRFFAVAHLVVSGLAARMDLTLDRIDDLVLAVDSLLERRTEGGAVTIALRTDDGTLETEIGPFSSSELRSELEEDSPPTLGVRRILETTADDVEVRDGHEGFWVRLAKRADAAG